MDFADLELGIHQYKEPDYRVDFRLNLPNSDAEIRTAAGRQVEVHFDFERLRAVSLQSEEYGRLLTGMLFGDPALRAAFAKARGQAAAQEKPIRLRLFVGPSAPRLHALRWENLLDPESLLPLATDENIIFSRYLASPDDRPVRLQPKGNLCGLVVVASPEDPDLARIDVAEQVQLARQGLEGISLACLPEMGEGGKPARRATLENLLDALRAEPGIDILYLVCHGMIVDDQPYLFLENDHGGTDRVSGNELARHMQQQLSRRPRLVVLVSCQSAGTGTGETLAALGPRLADIGVPAVIAMQSNFTFKTAARFLPKFFRELQRDGQIDRAVAAARAAVCERFDAWVPVLFMRLRSGRLWYKPGFTDRSKAARKFPAICQNIERKKLTPIIGPVLVEPVLGSLREIARRWANDFNYPLSPHERESLPQVAQFLAINQQVAFPFRDLEESLKKHIIDTYPGPAQEALSLDRMIERVVSAGWQPGGLEPHQVLARLELPIFITANQDTLLEAALRNQGKSPLTILCPWNKEIVQPDGMDLADLEGEELGVDRPVVFHLFGLWDQPASVVLTEDQYFQYLLRLAAIKASIPEQIREALANSGLLFLGFQIEEWSFRVIFHSLLSLAEGNRRGQYTQLAAQLEPEDERILEPALARQYLEEYFKEGADIDIYWGRPEEFMIELDEALRRQGEKR